MDNLLVPQNEEGKQSDFSHSETFNNREDAVNCFARASKRLLNPRIWHKLCGNLSAEFFLADTDGIDPHRLAKTGDFFKIDIPGPGPSSGAGYDWVKVALIEDRTNPQSEEEYVGMKLRPSNNPATDDRDSAHFFQGTATSSYIISRTNNTVTASYHGRNEAANIHTSKTEDNVRNLLVATGAFAGLSEVQWITLIKAFLKEEIGG